MQTAGLILAMGKMLDSIFSGLKLLTPMLLINPSSTHFSRAAQVSSKGGSTFGPGFTDVGLPDQKLSKQARRSRAIPRN